MRPLFAMFALCMLCAAKPQLPGGSVGSPAGLDIQKLLDKPGVRFLAVTFLDSTDRLSRSQTPKWREVVRKRRKQGLYTVTVTPLHPQFDRNSARSPQCMHPGWQPDAFRCDAIGFIATGMGVEERPKAFLWEWPGRLLAQNIGPAEVDRLVAQRMRELPRISKGGRKALRRPDMPRYYWGDPLAEALQQSRDALSKVSDPRGKPYLAFARKWIGVPYELGGKSQAGIDDYELVRLAFKEIHGIDVGVNRREQVHTHPEVPLDMANAEATLIPGDIIGWVVHANQIPRRVGVYLGNGYYLRVYMVKGVTVSKIPDYTWETYWLKASRPLASTDTAWRDD